MIVKKLMSRLLPLCLVLLWPVDVAAQRLSVSENTIDCGRTGYLQPVTATFKLRNKGLRHLVIKSVKADCGCTTVEYPKESISIGERFTIRLTYDARQLGHFQKQVRIESNGSKKPVYLTMKGVVLTEVKDYSGDYPISLGDLLIDRNELEYDDVNKGDAPVQQIHMVNNGEKNMTPNVMHLPPYLSAKVTPAELRPGQKGVIDITLNSSKLRDYGLTQTSVYIAQQLGEKVSAKNEVGVSTILLPDLKDFSQTNKALAPQLQISATDVDFTDFGGKSKKTADVILFNAGKSTLNITSMQLFTGGLKVTLGKRSLDPGETTTMKITGYAEDLEKVRTKPRILMITNDPDKAKIVVNIHHAARQSQK